MLYQLKMSGNELLFYVHIFNVKKIAEKLSQVSNTTFASLQSLMKDKS
jgi:hypothetical protein